MSRYLIVALLLCLPVLAGCMMPNVEEQRAKNEVKLADEGITALTPGDETPAFTSTTHLGAEISIPLDDGERQVVLFFYPADDTPNTTRQLQQLSKLADGLAGAGIDLYGISGGSARDHNAYAGRFGITLPLLADAGLVISAEYGCAPAGGEFVQRTMIGIDPDGTVAFFKRGFPMGDPATKIKEWFGLVAVE